jgi:predicted metal-dependent phosphoesterase TrpH
LRKIDFVEAINSSTRHEANINAISWGQKVGKPFTGGSDGHAACFIGKAVTAVKSRDFLDNMKNSLVVGTEVNKLLLTLRHLLKIRMFSKFPKFYIKKLTREKLGK